MSWKKMRLKNGLLYVILDDQVQQEFSLDFLSLTEKLCQAGVDLFQLRCKNLPDREVLDLARALVKITANHNKLFIVNDRADIAKLAQADGLHLGEGDIAISDARELLGQDKIIGKTVHSAAEFTHSIQEPLDYLSLGPVFATKTKPELPPWGVEEAAQLSTKTRYPVFVIGGITEDNVSSLTDNGIHNIALCRGVLLSKDYRQTVTHFKQCLKKVL
jgi:thiamine-phosphate pyrophosphorylase